MQAGQDNQADETLESRQLHQSNQREGVQDNANQVGENQGDEVSTDATGRVTDCPIQFADFKNVVFVWKTDDLNDLAIIQKVVRKGCVRKRRLTKAVKVYVVKSREEINPAKKPFKEMMESGKEIVFTLDSWFKEIAKESVEAPPNLNEYFVGLTHPSKSFYFVENYVRLINNYL